MAEITETLEKEVGFPKISEGIKLLLPAEPPYMPLPAATKELQEKIPILGDILAKLKKIAPSVKLPELPEGEGEGEGKGTLEELGTPELGELEELPGEVGAEELEEKEGVVY